MLRGKSLRRFVLIFILFLACILLMLIPLYRRNLSLFEAQELAVSSLLLKNGLDHLDSGISSLTYLVVDSYGGEYYRRLAVSGSVLSIPNYYAVSQVQIDFKRIMEPQAMVSDCGILFDNGFVLTRFRNFPQSGYYDRYFAASGLDFDGWRRLLTDNLDSGLVPGQSLISEDYGSYDALILTTGMSPLSSVKKQSGIFYAAIDKNWLLKQMTAPEVAQNGFVLITDAKGRTLLNHRYQGNAAGYRTFSCVSQSLKFHVSVGIPESLFYRQMSPLRSMIAFYLLVVLAAGILLALFFAYGSSLPLRRLAEKASSFPRRESESDGRLDEYNSISKALSDMGQSVSELAEAVETQKSTIRANLFEKALFGTMHSGGEPEDFRKVFPDFPAVFRIALVRFSPKTDAPLRVLASRQIAVFQLIKELLSPTVYALAVDTSSVAVLLPVDQPQGGGEPWLSRLGQVRGRISGERGPETRIALSGEFHDFVRLSEAYAQVQHILQLAGENDDVAVWRLENFPEKRARLPLHFGNMQQLYDAVMAGEKDIVHSILDGSQKVFRDLGYVDEQFCEQVFYNLRGVLLRIKLEQGGSLSSLTIPVYSRQTDFLSQMEAVKRRCDEITETLNARTPSDKESFSQSVLSFIDANLNNQNLYSRTVMDRFGISETTLQKIVHGATGKRFFEYIEEHRLDEAFGLLHGTSRPVAEIAAQCGFSSYNSFYKAFRRRYRVSPGSLKRARQSA
jgi:AraC-like DNA-binding protein